MPKARSTLRKIVINRDGRIRTSVLFILNRNLIRPSYHLTNVQDASWLK